MYLNQVQKCTDLWVKGHSLCLELQHGTLPTSKETKWFLTASQSLSLGQCLATATAAKHKHKMVSEQ